MNQAFICDGVRTPIGRYGGALASARRRPRRPAAARAVGTPSAGRLGAAGRRDPRLRQRAGEDNRNPARMALLLAGVPVGVSGTTVNRLCGSGPMRWRWRRAASKPVTPGCCWRAARNR